MLVLKMKEELLKILQNKFSYKRHVVDRETITTMSCSQFFLKKMDTLHALLRVLIDRADKDENCPNLTSIQREALDFLDIVWKNRFPYKIDHAKRWNPDANWTLLHRRTEFEDFTEKIKTATSATGLALMPNSRPIDDAFIENYGSLNQG